MIRGANHYPQDIEAAIDAPHEGVPSDNYIADIHTGPDAGEVLEVGPGSVDLTVAAIDNHGDRAI